jgi:hypothetical protein
MGSLGPYNFGGGFFRERTSYIAVVAVSVINAHEYAANMCMVESRKSVARQHRWIS